MCKHKTCQKIRTLNGAGGVACVLLNHYKNSCWTVLLGRETGGSYRGTFNLCAGKLEQSDNGCYISALRRELLEEFKINATTQQSFDDIFKGSDGKIRFLMHRRTPVFVGVVQGLSRKQLNPILAQCQTNYYLPHCQREMDRVEWFHLSTKCHLEGCNFVVSSFAGAVMNKVDVNIL